MTVRRTHAVIALGRVLLPSFVTASQATSQQLAFVNSAGNAVMKVDNKTNVAFNDKRNTVRISTKDRFAVGSVWIADMLHVPFGVSFVLVVSMCRVTPIKLAALHKKRVKGELSSCLSPRFFATSGRSMFCVMPILTPLVHGALPMYVFSAPSGPPSGLKPQTGPQAVKSTRSKASTWSTTRSSHCTPSLAAPPSTRYKRVRSSIRPTVPSRQTRTRGVSWRIQIRTLTELLLRLLAGACSLLSLRKRASRASPFVFFF
jgi:hypothetical protein